MKEKDEDEEIPQNMGENVQELQILNQDANNMIQLQDDIIPEEDKKDLSHKKIKSFTPEELGIEIQKDNEMRKTKEIHNSYLYNIKDYIFCFGIMISSSINFSYLYLLYVFFGIIYIFLIRSNNYSSKKLKFVIEIISFIYSILLTIFKVICLILIKKDNSFLNNHKDLFLNLGICYFRDTDSFFYFLMTFLGEAIMIFFSLYSFLVSLFCREFRELYDTSLMENNFWTNRNLIMLNYIFILCFSVYNVSFLTLFYMSVLQLIFFIDSVTNNRNKIKSFFNCICHLFFCLILAQVTAINVLNIPKLQEDILHEEEIKEEDSELFDKVYSIWTKIGINYAYHHKLLNVLKEWIGYFAAVCSLLSLSFTVKTIKVNEQCQRQKINKINLRTAKTILKQSEEEKEKEKENENKKNEKVEKVKKLFSNSVNYIKKLIQDILNFITSPTFIIQFSRIMSIAWMYFYRNFYSLGIFITLFFSFLFISTKSNKYLTLFLLTPMIFISLVCFHFSNINGYFEENEKKENEVKRIKYLHFGLGKYEYSFLEYFAGNVFYIFTMFLLYSFYNSPPVKEEDNKNKLEKYNLEDEEENDEELNEPLLEINNSGKVSIPNNQKEGASLNSDENIKIEKKKEKKEKKKKY